MNNINKDVVNFIKDNCDKSMVSVRYSENCLEDPIFSDRFFKISITINPIRVDRVIDENIFKNLEGLKYDQIVEFASQLILEDAYDKIIKTISSSLGIDSQ